MIYNKELNLTDEDVNLCTDVTELKKWAISLSSQIEKTEMAIEGEIGIGAHKHRAEWALSCMKTMFNLVNARIFELTNSIELNSALVAEFQRRLSKRRFKRIKKFVEYGLHIRSTAYCEYQ